MAAKTPILRTRYRNLLQPAVVEGVPVEMVPTTAREHITGFAALNIPHRWRLGGDWHEAWFDVEPTRVSPSHITDERRFGRLLDRLGQGGLRDARPGLALLDHPARNWPEKVWAATHERAVIEMAWARLERMAGKGMPAGLPPIDRHDFYRILPHPDQWVRVRWWAWRLREGADADGAGSVGPAAERVVAMRLPGDTVHGR